MDQRWDELRSIAGHQHGQVAWQQAVALGFTSDELRRSVERGVLAHPDVRLLSVVGGELSHRGRLWALQLSVKRTLVACAFSAAWMLGLQPRPPSTPWVMVRGKWAPSRDAARVVTCRRLPEEDITADRGLLRTTAARTLVDMAAHMATGHLRGLVLDARQRGLVTIPEVVAVAERRVGARGVAELLRICHQVGAADVDSELEAVFRDALASSSLPPPAPHQLRIPTHRGGTRKLDVAWPAHRVGAECDGLAFHASRRAHDLDAVRRTELNLTPFRIVHVTWARVELGWPELEHDLWTAMEMGGRAA